ncbi:MAG TPA: dihydrodipicolinate reductase [Acidimicrobiia bacterium]
MPTSPLRVVVWSTGWIGTIAIRAVHRRPDLELVGVWVHSADKVGNDAGVLAGIDEIGIAATNDADALLSMRPDCVVYAANGPDQDAAAFPDYVAILEAGVNVVTVTSSSLVFPAGVDLEVVTPLLNAAMSGDASLYTSGIEPGFAADQLPLVLATQSNTITSVRASELFLYDQYPVEFMMRDGMGFGMPLDFTPMLALPGAQTSAWGPPIKMVAAGLGVVLDGIREEFDRVATDRTLEVACGTIEAGTCGAIRTQTIGMLDGHDVIVIEHVNRMAADLAPEWPIGERDGTYRIVIEGDPDITCTMTVGDPGAATAGAMVATAMRVVNAIPYVVAAPPGLLSALDMPLTLPRHAMAPNG